MVRHKTRLERLLQKNVGCSQIGAIKKERNAKTEMCFFDEWITKEICTGEKDIIMHICF